MKREECAKESRDEEEHRMQRIYKAKTARMQNQRIQVTQEMQRMQKKPRLRRMYKVRRREKCKEYKE